MTAPINDIAAAATALRAAAASVPKVRVFDLGASVDPPGVVVGPPSLRWETFCGGGPSAATFQVFVVAAFSDRAMDVLWDLAPAVGAAIDMLPDATVTSAEPTVFSAGTQDLPAYVLTVEVTL